MKPNQQGFTLKQQGFTLIELMIVVAIVGILMAVALPAYQDYSARAKISEVMLQVSACKTSLSEYFQTNGSIPPAGANRANAVGCNTTAETKYMAADLWVDGVTGKIHSGTIRNVAAEINGQRITLQPTKDAARTEALTAATDPILGWSCGTNAPASAYRFIPAACRQAPLGGL